MPLTKSTILRALLYALVLFLTPFADKVVPLLYNNQWPTAQVIVACAIVGLIAALIGVRAYFDGSAERARQLEEPPSRPPVVPLWIFLLPLAAGLLLGAAGCKTPRLEPGGAYAPTNEVGTVIYNDVGLAVADAAYKFTYETTLSVFRFERDHRAELWALSPKVKQELDRLRPQVVDVNKRWALARSAYKANPTPAGLSTLQTILSELQRLLPAAQSQLNQATAQLAQPVN